MNTSPLPTQNSPQLKVLLVEDSRVLAERLVDAINDIQGVDLIGTTDTEAAAVLLLQRSHVDVIVLDLHLKQGTGFGVMRSLETASRKPTVIVLTNYDLPEYKKAAVAMGATYFLDKALDYGRLSELLTTLGNAHRAMH